jgi:hypothetical protein
MALPNGHANSSGSTSMLPSGHIGPVRSLSSYDPATLASDGAGSSAPTASSRPGKGRASLSASDDGRDGDARDRKGDDWESDEDDWDAWEDGPSTAAGSARRSADMRPIGVGRSSSSSSLDDDDDERAMEHELKTLALAGDDGHVASEQELRKKLYWREAMVTGFFVLLWCVATSRRRRKRACAREADLTALGAAVSSRYMFSTLISVGPGSSWLLHRCG